MPRFDLGLLVSYKPLAWRSEDTYEGSAKFAAKFHMIMGNYTADDSVGETASPSPISPESWWAATEG